MNITLNHRPETLPADQLTVRELLEIKKFTFKMLIIRVNGEIVRKDDYDNALIHDGDEVMVLHLISGG